jgi:DNA-binding transcriptional regulator YiaG
MFKASSDNSQFRARRRALSSIANSEGFDQSIFRGSDTDDPYRELVNKKKNLQSQISKIKAQISLAKMRYAQNLTGQVSHKQLMKWESDRAKIAKSLSDIDAALSEMNFDRKIKGLEEHKSFCETFMSVAKEILVEEAYHRISIAAVHRFREQEEDREKYARNHSFEEPSRP